MSTEDVDSTSGSGYETDTVIPLLAHSGLAVASATRSGARGRQRRGLSLGTTAVGIAAAGISLRHALDALGAFERSSASRPVPGWVSPAPSTSGQRRVRTQDG